MINNFQKYVGQKVLIDEKLETLELRKRSVQIPTFNFNSEEKLIPQIEKEAADLGLSVRTFLPDSCGTCDHQPNRINIIVNKCEDNTFEISEINVG